MKANILFGIGDLRYTEKEKPQIKEGEVLLKVKACGICGSDVARVFVNGTYHFPTIIGHEFAGEVAETYAPEDQEMIGKRYTVFPLIPCQKCDCCKQGAYEMCSNYNYLGSRCDGGFADYVAVPKWNLLELPENVSIEEAAMMEPASVAMHATKRSNVKIGDVVVIFGPGTIGMILAQLMKIAGASKVILVGRSQEKLDYAHQHLGIECTCNSEKEDVNNYVLQETKGRGANVVIEGTGASATLNKCLEVICPEGILLTMGNPLGDMNLEQKLYWKILRKQLTLIGTWNSSYGLSKSDWVDVINLLGKNQLDLKSLITHRLKPNELLKGLELMRDKKTYTNKVMIIND